MNSAAGRNGATSPPPPVGVSSGGNGNGGGSNSARLEVRIESLDKRLRTLEIDIATIKERLEHMPTKYWMLRTILSGFTAGVSLAGGIVYALIRIFG